MRKEKLQYDTVAHAAEKIKARGEKPSLHNVGQELGLNTTAPYMAEYLEQWYGMQPEFHRTKFDYDPLIGQSILESEEDSQGHKPSSLALVRATLESTADGIMISNNSGQVIDWNKKFIDMWRIPVDLMEQGPEKLSFDYILDQVKNPEEFVHEVMALYQNPDIKGELSNVLFKDGRVFERYSQPLYIGGELKGRVFSFRDVTTRFRVEQELKIQQRAIESSSHGIAIIDIKKEGEPIIYVNPAFEKITGYCEEEIMNQNLSLLQGKNKTQTNFKRLLLAIRENKELQVVLRSYKKSGERFYNEINVSPVKNNDDEFNYYVCIIDDITERKIMEEQLLQQATHDALTHLPNRSLLVDRVNQAILTANRTKKIMAMVFLDLDQFKLINDTLGHSTGDELLKEVANRLLLCTQDSDTVARIGGDEFITILQNLNHQDEAIKQVDEIIKAIQKKYYIGDHELNVTTSIGISFYPNDGDDYETLMKNSDLSMYHAKEAGRNTYRIFTNDMNKRIETRVKMETQLRSALDKEEFELNYQPLIDLTSQKIIGHEALIRWNNPILGSVSPADFIPLAEENGMIIDIGKWVIEQACKQQKEWVQRGFSSIIMAINLSGRQFKQKGFANEVKDILDGVGLDSKYVEFEMTESLLIDNLDDTLSLIYQLKDMGLSVSIDDFGTGYSSLAYLKQFPVDKLKIDRSFISEMHAQSNDAAITQAIINLAHSLKLNVLAEGVETNHQAKFLKENKCDFAQGYHFNKPMNNLLASHALINALKSVNKKE